MVNWSMTHMEIETRVLHESSVRGMCHRVGVSVYVYCKRIKTGIFFTLTRNPSKEKPARSYQSLLSGLIHDHHL